MTGLWIALGVIVALCLLVACWVALLASWDRRPHS